MNCFEKIRDNLDIWTVVDHYGIEIKRNNTCLCPFHDDHYPSAHIYPNAFHCFACNVHYDVLGFVMNLFELSAIDAAKKLNNDFNLGISFGKQKNFNQTQLMRELFSIKSNNKERIETFIIGQ